MLVLDNNNGSYYTYTHTCKGTHASKHTHISEWMNRQVDGWMDGWMNEMANW